jgi:hypothetical protein
MKLLDEGPGRGRGHFLPRTWPQAPKPAAFFRSSRNVKYWNLYGIEIYR